MHGVLERVADVQRAGDVRRRDDDGERRLVAVGVGPEVPAGYPLLVPSLLYLAGLVLAGKGRGVGASGIQSLGHRTSLRRASADLTCATCRSRTVSAMSDAHLTERVRSTAVREPVELTEEPIQLSTRDSGGDPDERSGGWSRRRKIGWTAALVVGLAGAGVLGVGGWRVAQQKDTHADLARPGGGSDPRRQRAGAEHRRLPAQRPGRGHRAGPQFRHGLPRPGGRRSARCCIFGGTTLLWQPERDLDSLFGLMSDETGAVTGLREVPAGDLGGVMKCGTHQRRGRRLRGVRLGRPRQRGRWRCSRVGRSATPAACCATSATACRPGTDPVAPDTSGPGRVRDAGFWVDPGNAGRATPIGVALI